MNLKTRLSLTVTLVLFAIIMIGTVVAIHNSRQSVLAEVNSTMGLAVHMLEAELKHFKRPDGRQALVHNGAPFDLGRFASIRHLRIEYYDKMGRLLETNQVESEEVDELPPHWFIALMEQGLKYTKPEILPIYFNTRHVGTLVISPEPTNEIIETWEETRTLLAILGLFFIAVNIAVYMIVARGLRPIEQIITALTDFESGQLNRRLPDFKLPEMHNIGQKFNLMAAELQDSIESNHRLTQQILSLQEEERKSLAHELHDEVGQHLTAIHVEASVIKNSQELAMAKQSAEAVDGIARQMMDILRSMLERLRPGGLDETTFAVALQEMVNAWQERHQDIDVYYQAKGPFLTLDERVQLTLYRSLQECLTNISRHAQANNVWVTLLDSEQEIRLDVRDDGRGFDSQQRSQRFGLAGMKERVDSVDGDFLIKTAPGKGVVITIIITKQERET